ncbi:hypothetical protein CHUAL_011444 [Chamberlinius hualienensis]
MANSSKKVAVVGSGFIGHSWAMVFASAGYQVSLYDSEEGKASKALKEISQKLEELEKSGLLRGKLNAKSQQSLIKAATSLKDCVNGAFFIQESVPEVFKIKRDLFQEIDSLVGKDAIISSSTSAIMPSKLSENLKNKDHFIVAHPANPPYFVPIVELVPASWTLPEVVAKTRQLMTEIGQAPVTCKKEQNGFALCRMQYAVINECWRLVRDGYLDVKDIDAVMTEGLGRRYAFLGAFEVAHLNAEGMKNYWDRYGGTIYNTQIVLGEPPVLEGPAAKEIEKQLNEWLPLEEIESRRRWRDVSLAALTKLRGK